MSLLCWILPHDRFIPIKEQQEEFGIRKDAPGWMVFCCRCGARQLVGQMFWSETNPTFAETARRMKYGGN